MPDKPLTLYTQRPDTVPATAAPATPPTFRPRLTEAQAWQAWLQLLYDLGLQRRERLAAKAGHDDATHHAPEPAAAEAVP